jgi:hypothetical protein
LLCKRSDRNIAANTRTVSRARPLWVASVRQVSPRHTFYFLWLELKIFLAHCLTSTGIDAILSLARVFPVLTSAPSEGEPRLQGRREAHGRSFTRAPSDRSPNDHAGNLSPGLKRHSTADDLRPTWPGRAEGDNQRPSREPNGRPHGQKSNDIKGLARAKTGVIAPAGNHGPRFADPVWG